MDHFYALIMAGGSGTRLWPLSRRDKPKQVLPLTEDRTLFQVTVERLNDLFRPDQIYVVAGPDLSELLHENTPQIPKENFIVEPSGRNSGPAAGLGSSVIMQRDPEAVIAVLSADHHIANEDSFLEALRYAYDVAHSGYIVTLGIHATYPATGFGYIQRGDAIGTCNELTAYASRGFTEKPNEETAKAFLASGMYSWNAGIFIWRAQQALAEFERQQPDMYALLKQIADSPDQLKTLWGQMKNLSLDYAIMEKAPKVAVIPVDIGWSDVGTWSALFDVLDRDKDGNATRSSNDGHIRMDTHGTLIVSDRMVVTIGVDNLVIVDTEDAILVCNADRAEDVKAVVQKLRDSGRDKHL
jgi:mannose-1-phosphate guanylyltransferase